ncbi:MAG: hypothetical protein BAJATHORv1_10324 [Candidatus Thorarchaeota archaeon]|nr:MAG: hypothetical protein BAJATHORv1_10324 [Candidatus Thorarchaeota archaeon]
MKIEDVEPDKGVPELIVRVISVAPPRIITTRGGRKTQLTEVLVADETKRVVLSLWGFGKASDLSAGKVIKIKNGWAKEWKGKLQLSLGRSGEIEEIDDDETLPSLNELMSIPSKVASEE